MGLPLFDYAQQAARTVRTPAAAADPSTSHESAQALRDSGHLAAGIARVVRALGTTPVRLPTSRELAEVADLDRHETARRLADALRTGLVTQGPSRPCRYSGRKAVTWALTAAGRAAIERQSA